MPYKIIFALLLLSLPHFVMARESKVVFKSRVRLRYDLQQFPDARDDVKRFHFQWRPLLEFRLHPSIDAGIEGFADATYESDEEDFLSGFDFPQFHSPVFERDNINDDVYLSRAFLRYSPSPAFEIVGGKFENPFLRTELLWSDNLSPNGAALTATYTSPAESVTLRGRIGDFYASHFLDDDINVVAIQGVAELSTGIARLTLAAAYYDHDVESLDPRLLRSNTRSGFVLVNDYNLLDFIGRIRLNFGIPLTAQVDFVNNLAADTFFPGAGNGDSGYMVDLLFGQLQEVRQFRAGLSFHRVESDAVLAAYNTDEWWFPTRGEGFRIHAGYVVRPAVILSASYLNQTLIDQDSEFERWLFTVDIHWP